MGEQTFSTPEVIVRVVSTGGARSSDTISSSSEFTGTQSFNALVYTRLQLTGMNPFAEPLEEEALELSGFPLVALEKIVVNWSSHRDYRSAFVMGEKSASEYLSKNQLFKEISPGLASLLRGEASTTQPLRIWWSIPTPNFAKLPWELLLDAVGSRTDSIYFVRGLPPDNLVPKLPVGRKLRLAFIHDPGITPPYLITALKGIENIQLIDMPDDPLKALQEVVKQNYELVHLVSDGSISLAYDGYLYMRRPGPNSSSEAKNRVSRWVFRQGLGLYQKFSHVLPVTWNESWSEKLRSKLNIETLSASQLSALQRGSRMAVLSLSPPNSDDTNVNRIDGIFLPSLFSAFAAIGGSALPMPNIVAQVGASNSEQLGAFWKTFYTELGSSLAVEKAFAMGFGQSMPRSLALFLRQRYRHTFKQQETEQVENVSQINAELELSREALQQLKEIDTRGFESILDAFEKEASVKQQMLQEKLDQWLGDEDNEPEERGASQG